jgi:hypothetical protein
MKVLGHHYPNFCSFLFYMSIFPLMFYCDILGALSDILVMWGSREKYYLCLNLPEF